MYTGPDESRAHYNADLRMYELGTFRRQFAMDRRIELESEKIGDIVLSVTRGRDKERQGEDRIYLLLFAVADYRSDVRLREFHQRNALITDARYG